ncbi:MAG: bifunctional glutamate N-acetyltransferase/amino-acid acetyltransferase ArgJ [Candidatus Omnitrophota bacterium]
MKLPSGFLFSAVNSGIKKKGLDLGMIFCKNLCLSAGFFTKNKNPSYSVVLSKRNIKEKTRAVIVNSGNANCFSDKRGLIETEKICLKLSDILGVNKQNVLIASTGIIGKKLPYDKISASLPKLIDGLGPYADKFASSILTTDTFPKIASRTIAVSGKKVTVAGFAKGAGMIHPQLATMLVFILSDAKIDKKIFNLYAKETVEESFNSITVDRCTSTNDSVYFLASGLSAAIDKPGHLERFKSALHEVCLDLAKMVIKDAEGATKFVTIKVSGAASKSEAKKAAFAVADSLLFKTAIYGCNPNWGRIIAALGQENIHTSETALKIKTTPLKKKNITVKIDLKRGGFSKTVYTSDITCRYVRINAEYS